MPEFVEFAGKKEYKCPRCKATIRYAKFFGKDKKVLTTDGAKPYFDKDRKPMSNTGWPTDPTTKQMHECKGDNRGNTTLGGSTDGGHNSQTITSPSGLIGPFTVPQPKEFPLDELIIKKQIEEDNKLLPLIWARYLNVKAFVIDKNETNPALYGLVFKILTKADKDE